MSQPDVFREILDTTRLWLRKLRQNFGE